MAARRFAPHHPPHGGELLHSAGLLFVDAGFGECEHMTARVGGVGRGDSGAGRIVIRGARDNEISASVVDIFWEEASFDVVNLELRLSRCCLDKFRAVTPSWGHDYRDLLPKLRRNTANRRREIGILGD